MYRLLKGPVFKLRYKHTLNSGQSIEIKQGNSRWNLKIGHNIKEAKDITFVKVFENAQSELLSTPFLKRTYLKTKQKLIFMFLPRNYPECVHKEYTPFTIYTFLNSISGTITSTFSMQVLLQTLGASPPISIALGASVNWIIKDGMGLLGGVIYASMVSTKFDSTPKQYRFLSNVMIQFSCLLEMCTIWYTDCFLFLASASNIGKNIGWLASSACKASIHGGISKDDNLGDITAKAGAQSTSAGLIGTALGVLFSFLVSTNPSNLFLAFIPLSAFNLYTSYKSTCAVVTRNLNVCRAEFVFHRSISKRLQTGTSGDYTPESVSKVESFIKNHTSPFAIPLKLDTKLDTLNPLNLGKFFQQASLFHSKSQLDAFINDPLQYRIVIHGGMVFLWYLKDATSKQVLMGFYNACVVRYFIENQLDYNENDKSFIAKSRTFVEMTFDELHDELASTGWDLDHLYFGGVSKRIQISISNSI